MPFKRKEEGEEQSINSDTNGQSIGGTTKKPRKSTTTATTTNDNKEISDLCQNIYDELITYQTNDQTNRVLSETFMKLPPKKTSVDYYNNVKQPIDLTRIQIRIKNDEYQTFEQFDDDLILLVSNAKQYYKKTAQEYKDACEIWDVYLEKKKKFTDTIEALQSNKNRTSSRRRTQVHQSSITATNASSRRASNTKNRKIKGKRKSNDDDEEDEDDDDSEDNEDDDEIIENEFDNDDEPMNTSNNSENGEDKTTGGGANRSKKMKQIYNNNPNINLAEYLEDYFDVICSCQDGGRYISNIFYLLPSAKDYPDYYEIIKEPIDLKTIANKILNNSYKTVDQMQNDLTRMINNAKKYNDPKSQLYKDARYLKKVIDNTCEDIENSIGNGKPYAPNGSVFKTREKKHKIVQEIAEMDENSEGHLTQDNSNAEIQVTKSTNVQQHSRRNNNDSTENNSFNDDASGDESVVTDDDNNVLWSLYTYVSNYRYQNQTLIDPFMKLPNKRYYPDYYEEIKHPIAFNHIKNNLKKHKYACLKDLVSDFELMFRNAMQYNMEDSAIYLNAKRLLNAVVSKQAEIEQLNPNIAALNATSRSSLSANIANNTPQSTRPSISHLKNKLFSANLIRLLKCVTEYCENGRNLSKNFQLLPVRDELPDYFDTITDPIDLETIRQNIEQSKYRIDTDMINDCMRVFENAKSYYKQGSQMYADAVVLQAHLKKKYEVFAQRANDATIAINRSVLMSSSNTPTTNTTSTVSSSMNSNKLTTTNSSQQQQPPTVLPQYLNMELRDKLLVLYNYINDYQEEGTGRELSVPFRHLPSKAEYPDYYNIIKKPIDMSKIYNKITSNYYSSIEDMTSDYAQLFENACHYNEPGSQIYKDALQMQKLLFDKRAQVEEEDRVCDVKGAIHEILVSLYESTINYQDKEFRRLSDSFVELLNEELLAKYDGGKQLITFDLVKLNLDNHLYRRLDAFQDDMFKAFDQIRRLCDKKSQIYKDSIDLQSYFIQKRDELCKNGEILVSNAFAYKQSSLEEDELYVSDTNTNEEAFANELMNNDQQTKMKQKLNATTQKQSIDADDEFTIVVGDFVYVEALNDEMRIACVLAIGEFEVSGEDQSSSACKLLVQYYLKPTEIQGHKHKFIQNEVFKSDEYDFVEVKQIKKQRCYVLGIKDYMQYTVECENEGEVEKIKECTYLCESMYSKREKLFRKIRKWPASVNSKSTSTVTTALQSLRFSPRTFPMLITRNYLTETSIPRIEYEINKEKTIEKPKENVLLSQSQAAAVQESGENHIYYEQVVYKENIVYKLGDYVYINKSETNKEGTIIRIDKLWRQANTSDEINCVFYAKGPVFLRPVDIPHEPTRLFYKNEVFKDNSREDTTQLDQIYGRCVVLSLKKYTACRHTEIDESDVYVCETKYVAQQKQLRKFTKGLKKFELSLKCHEDEVYFFKKELRIRKYLSPLLQNERFYATHDNSAASSSSQLYDYWADLIDENTNGSNSMLSNDNPNGLMNISDVNMTHNMNTSTCSSNVGYTPSKPHHKSKHEMNNSTTNVDLGVIDGKIKKRKRVKRNKKCGYNIFSKEFRKRLRDSHSSLSFVEMSREVGNQWRMLSETQRALYEEKAKEESLKEAARLQEVEEEARKLAAKQHQHQQQIQQQQQQQQPPQAVTPVPHQIQHGHHSPHINQIFAQQQQQQQQTNMIATALKQQPSTIAAALNTPQSSSTYSIINVTPQNAVQLNLNYGQSIQPPTTTYIIKPNNQIQVDQNTTIELNDYLRAQQQQQQLLQQQQLQLQQQQQQQQQPPETTTQKEVKALHSDAYMRYIERLKTTQHQDSHHHHHHHHHHNRNQVSDWQSLLDIRPSHMKESNMQPVPTNWMQNIPTNDVFKQLCSLRYYLLNDAVNIRRNSYKFDVEEEEELLEEDAVAIELDS